MKSYRLFPVGRLDRNSEGLLLMTNDGAFSNLLTHPSRHVAKVYRVTVREQVKEEHLTKLTEGIMLDGTKTLPCEVHVIERGENRTVLHVVLYEGRNRQIRRMCEYFGYRVEKLERVRIMNIKLGDLQSGQYREVTKEEYAKLMKMIKDSSNETVSAQEVEKKLEKRKQKNIYRTGK